MKCNPLHELTHHYTLWWFDTFLDFLELLVFWYQELIQHSMSKGHPTIYEGMSTLYLGQISQKLHKTKGNLAPRGCMLRNVLCRSTNSNWLGSCNNVPCSDVELWNFISQLLQLILQFYFYDVNYAFGKRQSVVTSKSWGALLYTSYLFEVSATTDKFRVRVGSRDILLFLGKRKVTETTYRNSQTAYRNFLKF